MRSRLLDDALRGKVMGCEERCEVIPPLVICRETSENRAGGGLSKRRRRVERKVTRVSLLSRFQHVTKTYSSVNTWSAKMYDGFGFSSLGFWGSNLWPIIDGLIGLSLICMSLCLHLFEVYVICLWALVE